jgi:hypothetical protein
MIQNKLIWLSHTAIESINRCQRCFWLSYKQKIKLPEGIQSRLANRFDIVIKKYFDFYRNKGELPGVIKNKINGYLESPFKEKYFYQFNDKYGFLGKLDECIVDGDGDYIPVDFKTSSSDPRTKPVLDAYQNQIDEYVFLLEKNKKSTKKFGYLIFFYPDLSDRLHEGFPMIIHIEKITAYPEKVTSRIEKAVKILENDIPANSTDCEFCGWFNQVKNYYK